ncbi:16S rRNA (guanine(527)-N(7))-methyltransferase RsmG [Deltaproteobacteria bacterium TL4]
MSDVQQMAETIKDELNADLVRSIMAGNGLVVSELQWKLIEQWEQLVIAQNQYLNLISRKDISRFWEKHVLHCASLLVVRPIPPDIQLCDFGTGGGFPGILLAILRPDLQVVLIDSTQKKIRAVERFISELALPNAHAVSGRGEELAQQVQYKNQFSVVVARAVAPLKQLEFWTRKLRKQNSVLHVYKGGDLTEELAELSALKPQPKQEITHINLKGYSEFVKDKKMIVSLHFNKSYIKG